MDYTDNPLKVFGVVWLIVVVTTLTIFALVKIGSVWFNMPPAGQASDPAQYNLQQCWQAHGVPVMDTKGESDDFVTCNLKATK